MHVLDQKYQVKPHSCLWFSAACFAAIAHRNHFLCLCQQNKSSASKVEFRQADNHCKKFLKAAKFASTEKTRKYNISMKFVSCDSTHTSKIFFSKGKFTIPPLFNAP